MSRRVVTQNPYDCSAHSVGLFWINSCKQNVNIGLLVHSASFRNNFQMISNNINNSDPMANGKCITLLHHRSEVRTPGWERLTLLFVPSVGR
ncbi:hypothetical protein TNCV_5039561 [Trichonephila clavipes]|nr:hypothetical protein TNCV_5039561 [Trichonephila clavipes]